MYLCAFFECLLDGFRGVVYHLFKQQNFVEMLAYGEKASLEYARNSPSCKHKYDASALFSTSGISNGKDDVDGDVVRPAKYPTATSKEAPISPPE